MPLPQRSGSSTLLEKQAATQRFRRLPTSHSKRYCQRPGALSCCLLLRVGEALTPTLQAYRSCRSQAVFASTEQHLCSARGLASPIGFLVLPLRHGLFRKLAERDNSISSAVTTERERGQRNDQSRPRPQRLLDPHSEQPAGAWPSVAGIGRW